jgi:hypothetical protein
MKQRVSEAHDGAAPELVKHRVGEAGDGLALKLVK